MPLPISQVNVGDWNTVNRNFNRLKTIILGEGASPTFAGLTLTGLMDTHVLYSKAGVLSGDATFNFNDTTKILGVDGATITGAVAIGLDMSGGTFATATQKWPAGTIQTTGTIAFQTLSDSTTAYQWLDTDGGTPVVNIDTTNERLGVGTDAPAALLHVFATSGITAMFGNAGDSSNSLYILNRNISVGYGKNTDNLSLAINPTGYLGGTTRFRDFIVQNGKGVSLFHFVGSTGHIGFGGEPAPETLIELTQTQPYITLHNSTHENSDGGRESRLISKGEKLDGTEHTLAVIEAGHDGTGDDYKAYWKLSLNDSSGGVDDLVEQIRLDSNGITVASLSATRLTATNGAKTLSSVADLTSWIAGTTDHLSVADDGDGTVTLDLDTNTQTLLGSFNGIFLEPLDFTIAESGGTVTGSLEQNNGGDLTQRFSDGYTTLDCTPALTIDLTAFVGTDAVPKVVFVYVLRSAKTVMAASNSDWPSTEHCKIAKLVFKSATSTGTDGGALGNQNINDFAFDANGQGHISHLEERMREEPAVYKFGIALTLKNAAGAALTTGNSSTAVEIVTTEGKVFQLHRHTFPAFDMYSVGTDDAHVVNQPTDSGGAYVTTADLVTDITRYIDGSASGVAIGVNKYFNLVIWGIQNRGGEPSHIMINLPTGQYTTSANAVSDVDGTSIFEIPLSFKGTGFLIARLTFRLIGGSQWTYIAQEDLRGKFPDIIAGVGITTTDHALLANLIAPADDHTQYLLADGSRNLAGAWNMASQILTNVNIDSGDINVAVTNTEWDAAFSHVSADGSSHSAVGLNTTHRGSNGSDHSFIDQDVTTTGTPSFTKIGANDTSGFEAVNVDGLISIKERASGDAGHAAYGKLWVENTSPNKLFFKDDGGADHQLGIPVDDTAYNTTSWDANIDAATKNAIRDKFVTSDAAVALNTTHRGSDGSDHSIVGSNTTAIGLNTTHRGSDGSDHSIVGSNTTAIGLNTTHRGSAGTDHSDVGLNTTHRSSDGSSHSKVTANETAITNHIQAITKGGTGQITAQLGINALSAVVAGTNEHVLTKDTGTGNAIWKVAGGSDGKVKVDVGATADYLGAAKDDGALRTAIGLNYTDGGDFVTIDGGFWPVDGTPVQIYTKYLTGTLDADSQTDVAHGVSSALTKILSVNTNVSNGSVMLHQDAGGGIGAANTWNTHWDATNIILSAVGSGPQGERYVIKIDYIL